MQPNRGSHNLKSIEEIPLQFRGVFSHYPYFNNVQSTVFDDVFRTDKSVVVSAPTGSGKTAIFELAIIKLLMEYESLQNIPDFKIIYISPIKALCQERHLDWHQKFSKFGLTCGSVTGDSNFFDFSSLLNYNLIITTPEKWDSITRRWRDNVNLVKQVKLFMIDEVHLLHEDRGSTLEVIVSRMKTIGGNIRYLAVSATAPNIEDIADWIGDRSTTSHFHISDEMRPVPLKKIVLGFNFDSAHGTHFKFDISLNYRLQNLLMQYSNGKPTLIFCNTRKTVEMTARHIVQNMTINLNTDQQNKLRDAANMIKDVKAKETLLHGVGYHHAGMMPETKHAIENLFRSSDLPILVTTSTLAMGVNLPAHLVIIKSTKCYTKDGFQDYSDTAIMQMIGRAGRPQFDTSGTAIILTTNYDKRKFENMIGGTQPIESNLHKNLDEHLNAEVVLGTIKDLDVALQWLSSTFLYIRARKNPKHYGLPVGLSQDAIDKKLLEMCQIQLNKLVRVGMLTMDQDIMITPTEIGIVMAKYCIAFETMKLFTKINGCEVLQQILAIISKCHEFSELYLRSDDKKCLNLLNKNKSNKTIRFPLNGKIKTLDMKINCIIQAIFGCLDIWDQSILMDAQKIMRNGERIIRCLIEYLGTREKCYPALLNSLILAKCFQAQLWENSPFVSKQLTGIGSVISKQLVNAGKTTFDKILNTNPRELEMIMKKKSPWGNKVLEEIKHIPKYVMTLELLEENRTLNIAVRLINRVEIQERCTGKDFTLMSLLVGDSENDILLYEQYSHSYMVDNPEIVKTIPIENFNVESISAHFLSDNWVGIDCNETVRIGKSDDKQGTALPTEEQEKKKSYMELFLDMYKKIKTTAPKKITKPKKKDNKPKTIQRTISQFLNKKVDTPEEVKEHEAVIEEIEEEPSNKVVIYNNILLKEAEKTKKQKFIESADIFFEDELSGLEKESKNVIEETINIFNEEDDANFEDFEFPDEPVLDSKPQQDLHPNLQKISQKYGLSCPQPTKALRQSPNLVRPIPSAMEFELVSCPQPTKPLCQFPNLVRPISRAMEFESALYDEEQTKTAPKARDFQFNSHKKLCHEPDSTVSNDQQSINKRKQDYNPAECSQKINNIRHKYSWGEPKFKKPGAQFPLKDKDYGEEDNLNTTLSDICSTSFMDIFSIPKKPKLEAPKPDTFFIKPKPLEFKPKTQENKNPEPLKIENQSRQEIENSKISPYFPMERPQVQCKCQSQPLINVYSNFPPQYPLPYYAPAMSQPAYYPPYHGYNPEYFYHGRKSNPSYYQPLDDTRYDLELPENRNFDVQGNLQSSFDGQKSLTQNKSYYQPFELEPPENLNFKGQRTLKPNFEGQRSLTQNKYRPFETVPQENLNFEVQSTLNPNFEIQRTLSQNKPYYQPFEPEPLEIRNFEVKRTLTQNQPYLNIPRFEPEVPENQGLSRNFSTSNLSFSDESELPLAERSRLFQEAYYRNREEFLRERARSGRSFSQPPRIYPSTIVRPNQSFTNF